MDTCSLEVSTSYFLNRSIFKAKERKMCILVGRKELPIGMDSGNGALEWMQQVKFFFFLLFFFVLFTLVISLHQSFIYPHNKSVFKNVKVFKFIYWENYYIPFCLPPQSLNISWGQENTSCWSHDFALFLQLAACFKLEKPRPDPQNPNSKSCN